MSHKLIGIAHSSNSNNIQYITDQLNIIKQEFNDLITEVGDENDERLLKYVKNSDRLPCLLLMKSGSHKAHINAKLSDDKALAWVREKIG